MLEREDTRVGVVVSAMGGMTDALLNLAALALFIVANVMLFLHVSMEGRAQTNQIFSGVTDLVEFASRLPTAASYRSP